VFKKTVEFEDFNGEKQTREFYFHVSKAELLAMATSADDMQSRIKRIIDAKDGGAILNELRELIKMSVGVRSEDGQRFIKDGEAQSSLLDSPAYDELLMELGTNANACVEFVQKLIPEKMQKEMQEQLKNAQTETMDPFKESEDNRPAYQKEHRLPTEAEIQAMSKDEIVRAMAWRLKEDK
jgi:hypothetical protein